MSLRNRVEELADQIEVCYDISVKMEEVQNTCINSKITFQIMYFCYQNPSDHRCEINSNLPLETSLDQIVYCFRSPSSPGCQG